MPRLRGPLLVCPHRRTATRLALSSSVRRDVEVVPAQRVTVDAMGLAGIDREYPPATCAVLLAGYRPHMVRVRASRGVTCEMVEFKARWNRANPTLVSPTVSRHPLLPPAPAGLNETPVSVVRQRPRPEPATPRVNFDLPKESFLTRNEVESSVNAPAFVMQLAPPAAVHLPFALGYGTDLHACKSTTSRHCA